jgi:hypothetical protein
MGWDFEKNDFPLVKKFTENCHKYNITVLAYVQFSTLYYETLQAEIPDLESWAAIDYNGKLQTYHGGEYYRWMPCIRKSAFVDYLKKIIKIGLTKCAFDGILFDNAHTYTCYCSDCQKEFRTYLQQHPSAKDLTGLTTFDYVRIPPPADDDQIKDPLRILYMEYSTDKKKAVFKDLYDYIKAISQKYIVSANLGCIRRYTFARQFELDCFKLKDCFDIVVSQSGNAPAWQNEIFINRIRENKLAKALGINILALSDHDGSLNMNNLNHLLLNLAENSVWNGISVERTIMAPLRSNYCLEAGNTREKLFFNRFFSFLNKEENALSAPDYCPIGILFSRESVNYSRLASRGIMNTEEILLRSHLPFQLITASATDDLKIPKTCQLLIVAEQYCLSDQQIMQMKKWISSGGKLLITPKSGSCDENFCEREIFFTETLDKNKGIFIYEPVRNDNIIMDDWTIKIKRPDNINDFGNLVKSIINLPYSIRASESVMVNLRSDGNKYIMQFLNYNTASVPKVTVKTAIKTRGEINFPFEEISRDFKTNNRFSFTMKTPYVVLKLLK